MHDCLHLTSADLVTFKTYSLGARFSSVADIFFHFPRVCVTLTNCSSYIFFSVILWSLSCITEKIYCLTTTASQGWDWTRWTKYWLIVRVCILITPSLIRPHKNHPPENTREQLRKTNYQPPRVSLPSAQSIIHWRSRYFLQKNELLQATRTGGMR